MSAPHLRVLFDQLVQAEEQPRGCCGIFHLEAALLKHRTEKRAAVPRLLGKITWTPKVMIGASVSDAKPMALQCLRCQRCEQYGSDTVVECEYEEAGRL